MIKKKARKKLKKGSKIVIGTTTAIATGLTIAIPVVVSSKNSSKKQNNNLTAQESKDPFEEVLRLWTGEEIKKFIEKDDKDHFGEGKRQNWFSGHENIDKWLKDDIHKIKGLDKLPIKDIKITHKNAIGKISVDIINHGDKKHFEWNDFKNEAQWEIDQEVTRIKSLKKLIYKTNDTRIAQNSLNINLIEDFDSQDAFTYTITHKEINSDKLANITIEVKKGDLKQSINKEVEVSGINDAKQKEDIQTNIDNVEADKPIPTIKDFAKTKTANNVVVDDLIAPTSTNDLIFTINKVAKSTNTPDGTTVTVDITVSSSSDGTTPKTYNVEVNGFKSEDQVAVEAEIARLQQDTTPLSFAATTTSISENFLTKDTITGFDSRDGFTYEITHQEITTDGTVDISIKVKKGNLEQILNKIVNILGINAANLDKAQADAKKEIDAIIAPTVPDQDIVDPTDQRNALTNAKKKLLKLPWTVLLTKIT